MATQHKAPLLAHLSQSPLLISQESEALFRSSVEHVVTHAHAAEMLASTHAESANDDDDDFWPKADHWSSAYRPYVVKNGVLQIPVMGVLLSRFPYQLGRWATGYQYIERALKRGMADENVKAIAFICDTPGGEVTECFELADKIYAARGAKPIRAFAANSAYSAGYAIACSCNDIVVTRSGGVGSIGVVTAHVDYSAALDDAGIKVTFIFAGKHKVDGNPYEKLPAAVKTRIQERINRIYGVFTSTVARNRAMDEDAVRATEALTYDANDAIAIGLADRLGALEEEMVLFADGTEEEDDEMATTDTITKADHEAALATATATATAAGKAEGLKEGTAAGATAERTRINAILASDEGKKRPKAAMSLAMKTALTLEEATAALAEMAEEKAETPAPVKDKVKTNPFEAAMEKGNPDVGAGGDDDDAEGTKDTPAARANSILADYAGQTGFARTKKQAAA